MADMLVNLLSVQEDTPLCRCLEESGIVIRRAMAPDKLCVVDWVQQNFGAANAGECDVCFSQKPVSCLIATKGSEILGFACYEATARGFFGPTGVLESQRGLGIGKALLIKALLSMREMGYVYAVIGGVGPRAFYEKTVGAVLIENSTPGIYRDYLGGMAK